MPPVVLTIAGYDPSSGAGVTADIKTIAAHRCFGVSCITAVTVQSTAGVRRVHPLAPELVREVLSELAADMPLSAVHIGMLGSAAVAREVAAFLKAARLPNVVLDPVLRSSSGAPLLEDEGVQILRCSLLPLATVATPNLAEAAALTECPVSDLREMRAAATRLHGMGVKNVVITGGHLPQPVDVLSSDGGRRVEEFPAERVHSQSTHGTGCAFSTALACSLACGMALSDAVMRAGEYVRQAIARAHPLGRGHGPIHHLFELD
jgi:hydroxymethylpyrimidine/phosphomethylpyrimidine kinase